MSFERSRLRALLLSGAVLLAARAAESQQVGVAAGYVRMPGRIGDSRSDHGFASRLGVYLGARSLIGFGFEMGFDRLNEDFSESSNPSCLLPVGGTGPCFLTNWTRDVGLSISAIAKLQTRVGKTTPYVLAGLGALRVRTHQRSEARDGNGNRLPNFEFDGSFGDGALLGHLGAGVAVTPGQGRLAVALEGRTSVVIYNYSGGLQSDVSPSIVIGLRW